MTITNRSSHAYIEAFDSAARQSLDPADYKLFRYVYLLGAAPKLCCRQLQMRHSDFIRAISRIDEALRATAVCAPLHPEQTEGTAA